MPTFTPEQAEDSAWLAEHPKSYLGSVAGWGKTRTLLGAADIAGAERVLVVCPAAIRDAGVWQREAAEIGFTRPLEVVSFHGVPRYSPDVLPDTLIVDEAHNVRNKDVTWKKPLSNLAQVTRNTWLASGTPAPKNVSNLWSQLSLIRDDLPAFWSWVDQWIVITKDRYSEWVITDRLRACSLDCQWTTDCEHWAEFYAYHYDGWMRRRTEIDLPDLAGYETPLWTPMTAEQARAYKTLSKDFKAKIGDDDQVVLEVFSGSEKFAALRRASLALGAINPDLYLKKSGKMDMLLETVSDGNQHLVTAFYKASADAIRANLDKRKISYVEFAGRTSAADRRTAVDRFQAGEVSVILGGVETIKEGITLTAAASVVTVERSFLPDINLQVVKRAHRRGQDRSVVVRNLVTPETVDTGQWHVIQDRAHHVDQVIRGADLIRLVDGKPIQ